MFPHSAVFLAGGPGKPRDSSGRTALALEPSTCSHAFAIVQKCEGPPDALLSSLPQRGPPGATFSHVGHPRFSSSSHSGRPSPMAPWPQRASWSSPCALGTQGFCVGNRQGNRPDSNSRVMAGNGDNSDFVVLCGPPTSGLQAVDTADPPGPILSPAPRRQDR